jgi:hypothetical protein
LDELSLEIKELEEVIPPEKRLPFQALLRSEREKRRVAVAMLAPPFASIELPSELLHVIAQLSLTS